eukprot:128041-Amphidinium_carterae.1
MMQAWLMSAANRRLKCSGQHLLSKRRLGCKHWQECERLSACSMMQLHPLKETCQTRFTPSVQQQAHPVQDGFNAGCVEEQQHDGTTGAWCTA